MTVSTIPAGADTENKWHSVIFSVYFDNTPTHTSKEVKTDVNILKGFSVNEWRQPQYHSEL